MNRGSGGLVPPFPVQGVDASGEKTCHASRIAIGDIPVRDPHVESLRYNLRTMECVSFDNAPPLVIEREEFFACLKDGVLNVEMRASLQRGIGPRAGRAIPTGVGDRLCAAPGSARSVFRIPRF